jgi:hypothetical protein
MEVNDEEAANQNTVQVRSLREGVDGSTAVDFLPILHRKREGR